MLAELAADRARLAPRSNYELFNCNNFNIRYWSWNYRGCWPFLPSRCLCEHFLSRVRTPPGGRVCGIWRVLGNEQFLNNPSAPFSEVGVDYTLSLRPFDYSL